MIPPPIEIDWSDPRWFEKLVEAYTARLTVVARRYAWDPEDVKDIVQETFMRAFKHQEKLPRLGDAGAWLERTAHNVGNDLRKAAHCRREVSERGEDWAEFETPSVDYEAERAELLRAIDELPELERRVVRWHAFDELSFREIAEATGRALSTITTSWYRALKTLARTLPPGTISFLTTESYPAGDAMGGTGETRATGSEPGA